MAVHSEADDLDGPVVVPVRAAPATRSPFPLFGCLAPLLGAAVLWAVLHSPLALVFALLSPVVALASVLDGAVSSRRARRKDELLLKVRRQSFRRRVDALHQRELQNLHRKAPSAGHHLAHPVGAFTASGPGSISIRLGTATGKSSIRVDGGTGDDAGERALRAHASTLAEAPVLAPNPARIAVVGPERLALAIARGYAVQLAAALSPHTASFDVSDTAGRGSETSLRTNWSWLEELPHAGVEKIRLGSVHGLSPKEMTPFVVVTEEMSSVPAEAAVVVLVSPANGVILFRHPDGSAPRQLRAEFVTTEQATEFAAALASSAEAAGLMARGLPSFLTSEQLGIEGLPAARNLEAAIGLAENGSVMTLDLVTQGPHAVVGGTTGSGKSELLVTWVAALARGRSPAEVTVLLVDFKGGSSFDALTSLPHCVGLITDLDPTGAMRALSSLRAEIRYRERVLRAQSARDIADSSLDGRLARLVIVVDEFAAMLSGFPLLHDVFADIAARGRSLGMHLILCTQRPAGVVRDSLLANCELRLSLRVNNVADSTALIGSPAASTLPATQQGRCYVAVGGGPPLLLQVAHTDVSTLQRSQTSDRSGVRRPWLAPLPAELALEEVRSPGSGVVLGRFDLPDEQLQPAAVFDARRHAPMLVLGSAGSGKTTLLGTIQAQHPGARLVPSGIEGGWDSVTQLVDRCRMPTTLATGSTTVLLLDDLDSLVRAFDAEHQAEFLARLAMLLRDGPARGLSVVATAQRIASPLGALAPLFSERILLRFSSRQEYLVAEGAATDHDPALPPGGGHWRGSRLQIARAKDSRPETEAVDHPMSPGEAIEREPGLPRSLIIVSPHGAQSVGFDELTPPVGVRICEMEDSPAGEDKWIIGTPDAWLSKWASFSSLRQTMPVLFDGCSLAEFRALTRRRDLPPPVDSHRRARWLLERDATVRRA